MSMNKDLATSMKKANPTFAQQSEKEAWPGIGKVCVQSSQNL